MPRPPLGHSSTTATPAMRPSPLAWQCTPTASMIWPLPTSQPPSPPVATKLLTVPSASHTPFRLPARPLASPVFLSAFPRDLRALSGESFPTRSHRRQPFPKLIRVHLTRRAGPALHRPAPKVEINRRDLRLDGRPQRPAHIRHDHLHLHPRQPVRFGGAKIGGAHLRLASVVELLLLAGVAQLECRVIIAAVLKIDQPQRLPVVNVVLRQQFVVARHHGQRPARQGAFDLPYALQVGAIAVWDPDGVLVHDM